MADKSKVVISILVVLVVILGAFIVYSFVITPAIQGYVVDRQNEGIYYTLNSILAQLNQTGIVQIPLGGDQVLTLIQPQMCSQIQQQQPVQ